MKIDFDARGTFILPPSKKEFEGQGYFSKLYRFMEEYLKNLGFKKLTLGVEPTEERNRQIYFYLGFTNFLFTYS